jgi:hypothetical protein
MGHFTKKLRQEIVEDFARRHNGQFNAALFLQEVRDTGPAHRAYAWFEWDHHKAALNYQLDQARAFASDLRIRFEIEEVGRNQNIKVKVVEMPLMQSPIDGRRSGGGGYRFVDPNDPAHMIEHCRQAASALRAWIDRYGAALRHAGYPTINFERAMGALEKASSLQSEAAE